MTKKIQAIVKLIRPINFLITFITVVVAAFICQPGLVFSSSIILAAFAASFTLASGNIINDIYDVEIDKINRSSRPLPSGKIINKEALVLYFIFQLLSLILSWFINLPAFFIVIIATLLLFLYSKYLKRIPLIGNITVAFLTGLVFIYGGIAVENYDAAIIPALFAFLINLIREIVKDMKDVKGDEKAGVVSFPIKYGFQKSKILILFVIILLFLFTFYPFLIQLFRIEYFIVVMVIVNPLLIYSVKILFEDHSEKNLDKISNILKLDMVVGLLAIFIGV